MYCKRNTRDFQLKLEGHLVHYGKYSSRIIQNRPMLNSNTKYIIYIMKTTLSEMDSQIRSRSKEDTAALATGYYMARLTLSITGIFSVDVSVKDDSLFKQGTVLF